MIKSLAMLLVLGGFAAGLIAMISQWLALRHARSDNRFADMLFFWFRPNSFKGKGARFHRWSVRSMLVFIGTLLLLALLDYVFGTIR